MTISKRSFRFIDNSYFELMSFCIGYEGAGMEGGTRPGKNRGGKQEAELEEYTKNERMRK